MTISAIYFKDENFTHVKVGYASQVDHLLINDVVVNYKEYGENDYAVEGRDVVVKAGRKKPYLSYYLNRETGEKISVQEYDERRASFKDDEDEFKTLESEYMYKKMGQVYMPVYGEHFEYEDVAVCFEEAELTPDKYTKCSGHVFKKEDGDNVKGHFVYTFDKWKFANDAIKLLMEEYGIPRYNSRRDAENVSEYYVLYDKYPEYKWLEFCGNEYFYTYDSVFGKKKPSEAINYGTYEGVQKLEESLKTSFRTNIERKLNSVRTVNVKKSTLESLMERVLTLGDQIKKKKIGNNNIYWEIDSISRDIEAIIKGKL